MNGNQDRAEIKLSIIVRIVAGENFLIKLLEHLLPQIEGRSVEVIVPYDVSISGVGEQEARYSGVRFVDLGKIGTDAQPCTYTAQHELIDRCTSNGLVLAQGEILCILEDSVVPDPDWCEQVLEAHRLPYGVIGGSIEHAGVGALNWAVYFQDFGRYMIPLKEGQVRYLSDVNISYKREALMNAGQLWRDHYNEITVNLGLAKKGTVLWLRPQMVVRQDRGVLNFKDLLGERYAWGRIFAVSRLKEMKSLTRLLYIILSPAIPVVVLGRIVWKVLRSRRNRLKLMCSLPYLIMLTVVWALGELVGYVTGVTSGS
jgi:hypothetical protein